MENKKFIGFLLIWVSMLLSCSSCSEKRYDRYTDFPEERQLVAEEIRLDTVLFRYPFRIKVLNDLALVLDLHNMDHYMHAFSYPDWRHLASFGKRGDGPEELLSAETFQVNSPDSVWILDANKMKITRWSVDVQEGNTCCREEILLDKALIRTLDFKETANGFIVPDYSGEYRYHILDRKGKILKSCGTIPTEKKQKEIPVALAQAWRSFMDYDKECQKLSLVTQLGEVLEVIYLNDSIGSVMYGASGEPEYQVYQGEGVPVGIMGFSDVQITRNAIYTVFHGRTFKEIEQDMLKGMASEDGGRFIYVFDPEGKPLRKYILDRAVYGISVDEEKGVIFATDVNSNNPIVKFKI